MSWKALLLLLLLLIFITDKSEYCVVSTCVWCRPAALQPQLLYIHASKGAGDHTANMHMA